MNPNYAGLFLIISNKNQYVVRNANDTANEIPKEKNLKINYIFQKSIQECQSISPAVKTCQKKR